ncbi:MAG: DUF4349 domain-containing protein [Candidatus Omnitrophota bacterium]|nr:MAG: DUF4349 domain-containing protein [Candidatus Omnitrophota bacterium]
MFKRHVVKELSAYLDNQLSERRAKKVKAHLDSCAVCVQELCRLKQLSEALKTWSLPGLSPDFDNGVKNEIVRAELQKGEVTMKKRTLAILIPSSALAMILVIAFLGSMQLYVKRGMQGRFKSAADEIRESYSQPVIRLSGGSKQQHADAAYGPYDVNGIGGDIKRNAKMVSGVVRTGMISNEGNAEYDGGWSGADSMSVVSGKDYPAQTTTEPGQGPVIIVAPVLPATGEGEKIIRTANVSLEVEDGREAFKKASLVCQELGGYLASSNFYKDKEGRQGGTITMRIPQDRFLIALDRINSLGKVESSYANSQDVSQEYANLNTQLGTAMIVYNKMLEALQKRQVTIPEATRLESELTPIRKRIEDLKNKIEYLNNAVSFTTITVNFREPLVSEKVLKENKRSIQENMLTAKINCLKLFANAIKNMPAIIATVLLLAAVLAIAYLFVYLVIRLIKRG